MRFLYFMFSSSLLIGLVLLIRTLFRKKLAPGVIYALWLIPLIRLLVPFAGWELPAFGTMADVLNSPYALVSEWMDGEEYSQVNDISDAERLNVQVSPQEAEKVAGRKIYDAVNTENNHRAGVYKDSLTTMAETKNTLGENTYVWIGVSVGILGSLLLGSYVLVQNRKLKRSVNTMRTVAEVDGLKVCAGNEVQVPCLAGLKNPKIMVPEGILGDLDLYHCVLQHELAHYHQKDHIWTAVKIFLCVLYWWNPFVWIAAVCVEEDAELACDARALKGQNVEERKAYGYALLQILENAQSKKYSLCMATSMSGNQKSMKRRIMEISSATATKKHVILPLLLLMSLVFAIGCGMPTTKSWMKEVMFEASATVDGWFYEMEYEFALQDDIKSRLIYYEVYEYGELTERHIAGYGDFSAEQDHTLKLRMEMRQTEPVLILKSGGVESEVKIQNSKYVSGTRSAGFLLSDNEKLEIKPGDDLVLISDHQPENGETIHGYDCTQLSEMNESQLKECLKDIYLTTFVRMAFSEKSEKELYETYQQKEYPANGEAAEEQWDAKFAQEWAEAYVDRDIKKIKGMANAEGIADLQNLGLTDEELTSFGWSSPWPMYGNVLYEIVQCDDSGAVIRYYASDSTPHLIIWESTLEFEKNDKGLQVKSVVEHSYSEIYTLEEFLEAYPEGKVSGTPMDYYTNGLGEALNQNALLSSSVEYQSLFQVDTAAAYLLNLSTNKRLVAYSVEGSGQTATVQIHFLEEGGRTDVVEVTMWQPYGKDGIWIPL